MVEGILIWGSQHRHRKANCHNGVERQISLYSHTDPFQSGSKYPPVTSRRDRSRYAAVFQDQYEEFLELQRQVGAMQAKLQQLEALLLSLPPPRSQVSPGPPVPQPPCGCAASTGWNAVTAMVALLSPFPTLPFQKEVRMAAHVRREFEKKRVVSGDP